jgi:hypothetical protein
MHRQNKSLSRRKFGAIAGLNMLAALLSPEVARADQGGLSFWLPGLFGSMAATPAVPGWAWTQLYYHTEPSASGGKQFQLGGSIVGGLRGQGDLTMFGPSYVFAQPVWGGGQAAFSLFGIAGRNQASIDATFTGPGGMAIPFHRQDSLTAFGDIVPQFTVKWNQGVNNYMTYITGDIPVGNYDPSNLANLGLGHGAIDAGGGYTYFDPTKGHEFSVTSGFTYNFKNTDLDYQNGVDWHVDFGASQFLSKQFLVGVVGYWFQQISGDSGSGATLGGFKSRVGGIGPQIGFILPMNGTQAFLGVKAYKEFAAENRPEGWNLWVTLSLSPEAPVKPTSTQIYK